MNEPKPNPTKANVFAYFDHLATPLERQLVENWLNTAEGTILYFTYLDEWERQHPQFHSNLEQAHEQYMRFMKQTNQTAIPKRADERPVQPMPELASTLWKTGELPSLRWLTIAASVVLIMGLWLSADRWYYVTLTNGYRQIRTVTLPDGSGVVLGTHSSLRYARFGFDWKTRRVWLSGEAQFRVIHQANDHRFTVQTSDQTTVEVLGTVFVVNSRRNTTRVMLETGRIRMTPPGSNQSLMLAPGDVVTVSAKGRLYKQRPATVVARVTWHDHRFIFHNTPLTDVASQLHDIFGVTVNIPQAELMNRTVSGTFQAETADDLLQALTLMMNLRVEQTQLVYTLSQ